MAIILNVKCKSNEEMNNMKNQFHTALSGTPAYINSEIAICDDITNSKSFNVLVGNCNDNDIRFNINGYELLNHKIEL